MRKFTKSEIDLMYQLIKSDEEVLWKSKPHLVPDFTILTSLFLFLLATSVLLVFVAMNPKMPGWYLMSLIIINLGIIVYGALYAYLHYLTTKDLIYVITNTRLIIIDTKTEEMLVSKRYSSIKILRIKKTIFNTASIVFDIDLNHDNKMKEIGFVNVVNADQVLHLIQRQLSHLKIDD